MGSGPTLFHDGLGAPHEDEHDEDEHDEEVVDMSVGERARALVEPPLAEAGFEVVDVVHTGATLRVTVDRPGGIDLDAVTEATRLVSDVLDRHDPVPGRYVLEVSSPGLERPLRTPEHFRRHVGTPVTVRLRAGVEGERRVDGTLEAADDEGVEVAGRRLRYDDIDRARTRFEWRPAERPGGKRKSAPGGVGASGEKATR